MGIRSHKPFTISLLLTAALLSGSHIVLHPQAAMACNRTRSQRTITRTSPFRFQNGLQIGTLETKLIQTLGPPSKRQRSQSRCPSRMVRFNYGHNTTVTLDVLDRRTARSGRFSRRTVPTKFALQRNGQLRSPRRLSNRGSKSLPTSGGNLVVVRFRTRNPQWVLNRGIRVGDSLQKLLRAYGKPKFQSNRRRRKLIRYQNGKESLRLRLTNDRIDIIDIQLR